MNDIEKAMAFLREERLSRPPPPVAAPVKKAGIEPPSSDVERSVESGAAVRIRPDGGRRGAGIGNDVSASVAGASIGQRNSVHSNTDRWDSDAADGATPPPGSRRRFDEDLFDDDLLDGVGAGGDRSALDMPELGIVTNSAKDDAFARNMPELGIVASLPPGDDSVVPDAAEPDIVSDALPCVRPSVSDRSESGAVPESSSSDHESVSGTLGRSDTARAPIEDDESPVDAPLENQGSGSFENGKLPAGTTDHDATRSEPRRTLSLPLRRLAERGFLTPGAPKGRLSEEFRRVKRPILRNIADAAETDGHRNVVMVTSSVTGEGKTYTAINLAMSLAAERGRTVLLVDADVLKGSAGTFLGVDGSVPGLIDVLDDERLDIADVMLATDVPDLRFVPAGRRDEQTTELLSSPRMSDLIDELAHRHSDRIIVLDCPPMLQTNEANVIVDHAGQIVFVVAGEETDQRLVLEAMRRFDEDKSVGVLLNKASGNSAAYGYDYGYG